MYAATDDVSRAAHIRERLLRMIAEARRKVFFCSFLFADEAIVAALCSAAERLRGGVYILTALGKHLRPEVLELDEELDVAAQQAQQRAERHEEHLRRLAHAGAWLRSAEDCHAKFCVEIWEARLIEAAFAVAGSGLRGARLLRMNGRTFNARLEKLRRGD